MDLDTAGPALEAQQLDLVSPTHRQIDAAGQEPYRQIGRLLAGQDGLDDTRREKGKRKQSTHVFGMRTESVGNILARDSASICKSFEIGMGTRERLDQRSIRTAQGCWLPVDYQAPLDATPADRER